MCAAGGRIGAARFFVCEGDRVGGFWAAGLLEGGPAGMGAAGIPDKGSREGRSSRWGWIERLGG